MFDTRVFAIGMNEDAIDLKYAKEVADYLHSEYHEIIINKDIVLSSLEEVDMWRECDMMFFSKNLYVFSHNRILIFL